MDKLQSVYFIEDTKEIKTDIGKGEFKKIYLTLEGITYDLKEFKEYVDFIFNENMGIDELTDFYDIIRKVQTKHFDFLNIASEFEIYDCKIEKVPMYKLGVFTNLEMAEKAKKLHKNKLQNPRIIELSLNQ